MINANTSYVTVFGKCWDLHIKDVLKTSLNENLKMIEDTIKFLISKGKKVYFDIEHFFDGYKSNKDYTLELIKLINTSGALGVILCDTNGSMFPDEVYTITKEIKNLINIELGIHTHNDTGLAVANTLSAIKAGANQIQGTLIGFGERTGNANLSTIIANLETKTNYKCLPKNKLPLLTSTCLTISEISNVTLDDSMPYVGKSAFAHKAGMHIDAVIKNSKTFEHINPTLVGNNRRFLLSEVSGRNTILEKLKKIKPGITKDNPLVMKVINKVKDYEYKGYQFEGADASFILLSLKVMNLYKPFFNLETYKITCDNNKNDQICYATIKLKVNDKFETTASEGDGPVNALDLALRKALEVFYPVLKEVHLTDFKVRVIDTNVGTKARIRVLIESTDGKEIWTTVGVSTDIIDASWNALVDSLEYKLYKEFKGEI